MKLIKKLLILVLGFSVGGVFAQSAYLGYGLGLQFDLGGLGGTITKDGLDNRYGTQKIIIPENTIDVYHRSGLVSRETTGAMTGLALSVFYERDMADFFYRIEGSYTRKILGGYSKAQIAGYTFIEQSWDFYSLVVPLYLGIRANVSESASVYGAFGVNYFRGGWSLSGTVDGATPCYIGQRILKDELRKEDKNALCGLGPNGLGLINPYNELDFENPTIFQAPVVVIVGGSPYSGSAFVPIFPPQAKKILEDRNLLYKGAIFGEQIVFDVSGIGFNFLIGIDKKLQSGSKFYFELEYLISAKNDNAPVRSQGTVNQLASSGNISYPIVVGGLRYRLGFKKPL
jgi:hypothetical protein